MTNEERSAIRKHLAQLSTIVRELASLTMRIRPAAEQDEAQFRVYIAGSRRHWEGQANKHIASIEKIMNQQEKRNEKRQVKRKENRD